MAYLFINTAKKYSKINKNIYGHFAEHLGRGIYGGIFVGEDSPIANVRGIRTDVVEALRNIKVPVIRWPGGCFAEYYNWRDGIGTKEERKRIVNTAWGGVVEDNSFGTHEFFDFCEQIGCSPYIAGNVGSGTPRELSEWIEYITFGGESPMSGLRRQNGRDKPWELEYVGVGNENWGCGGRMRAEYYSDIYRRFATYIRKYSEKNLFKVACGADGSDYEWTDTVMRIAGRYMDGLSLHYYTMPEYYAEIEQFPWEKKGPATGFDKGNYYRTLKRALYIDELISRHKHIMDRYDPKARVAIIIDEWGAWHLAEPETNPSFLFQQNTMRDAVLAAVSLNIFNSHSDRVRMANLAQMINVLQSVILTEGESMVLTPTYHVFDLFKGHQDSTLIESYVQQDTTGTDEASIPVLHCSASERADGKTHITLVNLSADEPQDIQLILSGKKPGTASIRYIAGDMNSHNQFNQPPQVSIKTLDSVNVKNDGLSMKIPACCVAEIVLD